MKIRVKVPKLGLTIEEVEITEWNKAIGESVAAGDVIATVEADKAAYEIPSPVDGILTAQMVEAGEVAAVGADIAVIEVA